MFVGDMSFSVFPTASAVTPVFRLGRYIVPIFKRSQLHLSLLPDLIYDKHSTVALGYENVKSMASVNSLS